MGGFGSLQTSTFTSEGHFSLAPRNTRDSVSDSCNLVYKEMVEKIQSKDLWIHWGAVTSQACTGLAFRLKQETEEASVSYL